MISISVCYCTKTNIYHIPLQVEAGCSLRLAIERSGLLRQCQDINLSTQRVGIYGQLKTLDDSVQEGDRIEIYRPLEIDPKQARVLRAQVGKK